jgi:muramoyltetrapeptide carboxypeptidase
MGIETMHATMAAGLAEGGMAEETLHAALMGDTMDYRLENHALSREGTATGQLVGGNLAILAGIAGTVSDIRTDGKILFIEEVGEHLYRIDRMMWTLRRAGKFERLAGLVVGGMTEIPDAAGEFGKEAYEIISEHVQDYRYPVCFGFPAGHQSDNRAMILGRTVTLEISGTTRLTF